MTNIAVAKAADLCDVPIQTFFRWLREGRIVGAEHNGKYWIVPKTFRVKLPYSRRLLSRAVPGPHKRKRDPNAEAAA